MVLSDIGLVAVSCRHYLPDTLQYSFILSVISFVHSEHYFILNSLTEMFSHMSSGVPPIGPLSSLTFLPKPRKNLICLHKPILN